MTLLLMHRLSATWADLNNAELLDLTIEVPLISIRSIAREANDT